MIFHNAPTSQFELSDVPERVSRKWRCPRALPHGVCKKWPVSVPDMPRIPCDAGQPLTIGDQFGESLGGSQAPPASPEVPGLPQKFPGLPRKFFGDFPGSSLTVELNSIQRFPGSFPDFPGSSPDFPGSSPDFPGGQPLSLGSLTPSPDSQKLFTD